MNDGIHVVRSAGLFHERFIRYRANHKFCPEQCAAIGTFKGVEDNNVSAQVA
jgi:hypothetical protein